MNIKNIILITIVVLSSATAKTFATKLCSHNDFECYKIQKTDSWATLFPEESTRLTVMKLNRTNTKLYRHKYIAIPKNLFWKNLHDFSPMPYNIDSQEKKVIIDINKHAFGAYNASGELVKWGPISAGRGYCPDTKSYCRTVTGVFSLYRKGSVYCKSGKYPLKTNGGAPMPYCMFFHRGFAMHGSTLPGYHASHGCIRLFHDDAKWLNQEFTTKNTVVEVSNKT